MFYNARTISLCSKKSFPPPVPESISDLTKPLFHPTSPQIFRTRAMENPKYVVNPPKYSKPQEALKNSIAENEELYQNGHGQPCFPLARFTTEKFCPKCMTWKRPNQVSRLDSACTTLFRKWFNLGIEECPLHNHVQIKTISSHASEEDKWKKMKRHNHSSFTRYDAESTSVGDHTKFRKI